MTLFWDKLHSFRNVSKKYSEVKSVVAKYPNHFMICRSTSVPNLVLLVSQNANTSKYLN